MMVLLQKIYQWLRGYLRRKEPRYQLVSVVDIPDEDLAVRAIYHIGIEGNKWCIVFICPCGCGETIYLNTLKNDKARWRIHKDTERKFSISPSVYRQIGCRSHFWIRENKAVFV